MQKAMSFDVAIVPVKGIDFRIYFWYMSKDEAINIMKQSDLREKKWIIVKIENCKINFFSYLCIKDQY